MTDVSFTQESLPTLCRLCLKREEFLTDMYHRLDQPLQQESLQSKIFDLYQVKVEEKDGLPTNICHKCLYLTESFFAFRKNVKQCEAQLKSHLEAGVQRDSAMQPEEVKQENQDYEYDSINGCLGFVPNDDCEITVVDPNQEYESSDDGFSMEESDNEFPINNTANNTKPQPETVPQETVIPPENPQRITVNNPVETGSELKNTFLCQYCDMAFTAQTECDEHESRHDAANPFSCNFCPFRTMNRQVLIHHIKKSHDVERPYVCALCNKGFCRRSDLKKHTIVHTGVRPFSCPVCSKSFSRNTNLTKHIRIHSSVKPHACATCPRSFVTAAELARHQRSHLENKPHKCYKCPASFARKDKLKKHFLSHLNNETDLKLEGNKSVPESNSFPGNPPNNKENNQQQSTEKYTPVGNCFTGISYSPAVNLSAKPQASFDNSHYAAQFYQTQSTQLPPPPPPIRNDHPLPVTNTNVKVHICEICYKTFTRKREFERHQALHLDSLYKCKACGKNFNRKDKLFRHEETHHSEQFFCNQCNISFSKLEALQMHLKIHELQKNTPRNEQEHPMALGFYSEIKSEE